MARMLQALKNLESRPSRPAVQGKLLTHLAEEPPNSPERASPPPAEERIAPSAGVREVATVPEAADAQPTPPFPAPPALPEEPPHGGGPAGWEVRPANGPVGTEYRPTACAQPTRPACRYETILRRTLSDPLRSAPLIQMAERLERDARQTASRTILLVGIGAESSAHDAAVYAGMVLANSLNEQVLLIDADMSRHMLSEQLEYGQEAGLAELLRGSEPPENRCLATAHPRLSILPAGLLRHADLSLAAARLEQVLHELATTHTLVLIDGGRTDDLAAATLARLADAAYFVVRLGTIETNQAQAALRDFRAAGARVLGCIAT